MIDRPSEQRHPLTALVLLVAIAFAGLVVFISLAQIIGSLIYGLDILSALNTGTATLEMQKLFIVCYSIGTFVIPPLVYARVRSKTPFAYLDLKIPKPFSLFLLAFVPNLFWNGPSISTSK